jgi:TolB protein
MTQVRLGIRVRPSNVRRAMRRPSQICALLLCALWQAQAEEIPAITVTKSDKLTIAVAGLSPADAKVLQNDLAMSGYFSVVPEARATFIAKGSGSLSGTVVDRNGKTVLQNSYSGSARGKVHAFADDIVETLTGSSGIANTKIAFTATKTGKKEIYTCDADGSNVVELTHDGAISVAPSLSADGSRLLYTGYQSGYADVYEIKLGSGARSRIMKYPGTNSGAAFSPDGGRIAVTLSKDGNPELYVTGGGGGGARRLTRTSGVESSPTWSPDGSEIIYSSDDRGGPQLFRISAGGGTPRLISTGHSYNTEPNWSPDGKKVAFNTRGGGFQVSILDLATGSARTVGEGQDPIWGADSRHLIFASGGSLILLDTLTGQRTTLVSGLGRISEPTWSR